MLLSADDINDLYTDPANVNPIIRWNGESGSLYAAILDHIFRNDKQSEQAAQVPANQSDPRREPMDQAQYASVRRQHKALARASRKQHREQVLAEQPLS